MSEVKLKIDERVPALATDFAHVAQRSFATQNNPGVFHRPQKESLLAKIPDPRKFQTRTPSSLKYVSGAPGEKYYNLRSPEME